MNIKLFIGALLLTAFLSNCSRKGNGNHIVIAFYNCENFFDTVHNAGKDDEEFTPGGKYHYTEKIFHQKLHNIATVIQQIGGDSLPDGAAIVGLAEVENNTVLDALVGQPEIARRNYKYAWFDGPDPRGINVALLYNPAYFVLLKAEPLHVDLSGTEGKILTRDVLHVYGVLGGDTTHVFVNHWPSRIGGAEESEVKRERAARVVKSFTDSLFKIGSNMRVIVMGDFNDNPTDSSIAVVLGAKGEKNDAGATALYDPWMNLYKSGAGTEEYKHEWNLFDQIIVSGTFLQAKPQRWHYDRSEIFKPGFLTDHHKGREGEPYRSFAGTYWLNGYSDHFPVVLYLAK